MTIPSPSPTHGHTRRPWDRMLSRCTTAARSVGRPVPAQRGPVRLTVMAEHSCSPLWVEGEQGVVNTPPAELALPEPLVGEIEAWSTAYERAAEPDEAFYGAGMRLAMRLAESLGPATQVRFFDGRAGCLRRV